MRRARVPVTFACVILSTSPIARSEPDPSSNVVFSGAVGVARFVQGNQAPPLCCGEREHWSALGAQIGLAAGFRALPWFEPGVEVSAGYLRGSEASAGRTLEASLRTLGIAPRVEFRFGHQLYFAPRLAWHFEQVSGDFVESTSAGAGVERSTSRLFTGPGLGVTVGYWVLPVLGVGGDVQGAFFGPDFSTALRLAASVSWVP